jgi:hypothetical protein
MDASFLYCGGLDLNVIGGILEISEDHAEVLGIQIYS